MTIEDLAELEQILQRTCAEIAGKVNGGLQRFRGINHELKADTPENPSNTHLETEQAAIVLAGTVRDLNESITAIKRIREGNYSTCERCKEKIPPERLKALPHARHCVPCKKILEAEEKAAKSRQKKVHPI